MYRTIELKNNIIISIHAHSRKYNRNVCMCNTDNPISITFKYFNTNVAQFGDVYNKSLAYYPTCKKCLAIIERLNLKNSLFSSHFRTFDTATTSCGICINKKLQKTKRSKKLLYRVENFVRCKKCRELVRQGY